QRGTLNLFKSNGATAIPGDLFIGVGTVRFVQQSVFGIPAPFTSNNQIAATSHVTIGDATLGTTGLLDLNSNNNTTAALTMTGGQVTTGLGTLTLGGDVTATSDTDGNPATIAGHLSLGSATRNFVVADGPGVPDLNVTAVVSGASDVGLNKQG